MHEISDNLFHKLRRRQEIQLQVIQDKAALIRLSVHVYVTQIVVVALLHCFRFFDLVQWQQRTAFRFNQTALVVICVGSLNRTQSVFQKYKRRFPHHLRSQYQSHCTFLSGIGNGPKLGKVRLQFANEIGIIHLFFLFIAQLECLDMHIVFDPGSSPHRHIVMRTMSTRATRRSATNKETHLGFVSLVGRQRAILIRTRSQ
mmetsp:Transcript_65215/g.103834  ORF Transcript_65215/g.103834 Transcript_65215/m.103834 type:complete len:201 (-) Transcript_65215:369-971(-)